MRYPLWHCFEHSSDTIFGSVLAERKGADAMRFTGGIFDIDGVVLDTPHEQAWREALDQLMAGPWHDLAPNTTYSAGSFSSAVYQEQVAGKPRDAGAAAVLAYFQVPDHDGRRTRQYAQLKQR